MKGIATRHKMGFLTKHRRCNLDRERQGTRAFTRDMADIVPQTPTGTGCRTKLLLLQNIVA